MMLSRDKLFNGWTTMKLGFLLFSLILLGGCDIIRNSNLGDTFARQKITLEFNLESWNGIIHDPQGKVLPSVNAFWFAWYIFPPRTKIFSAKN